VPVRAVLCAAGHDSDLRLHDGIPMTPDRRRKQSCKAIAACRLLLAALLISPWLPARAALQLQLDTTALTPAQSHASQRLLDDAMSRLPPRFKAELDRQIPVRWSDALPDAVSGRAERSALLLNRRWLPALDGADVVPAAGGREPREELLATVLHELAHFHDRQHRLSADPRLLDLAGWQVKVKRLGARQSRNPFSDRSPDVHELTSPREFVAVNFEYFLLDPDYACRRPALYRHFSAVFDWSPAHPDCAGDLVHVSAGNDADGAGTAGALGRLDPRRVYAVEYLLAEGNDEPLSRWGHSMLRLVVCAPGREPGPGCRLDLQHHLVLSFRAFVNDVQLSSWRGLSGSYPSRLFVLPLSQVVEEYTRDQLRGLQSIPLALEREEIQTLLERAGQLHWSYDGRYYFVSNNCAVETFKLLHDGVPRLAQARLGAITPTGLLKRLRRHGVADISVLDDAHEARRLGYRFDSLQERFQAMFAIARQELALPEIAVEDWLSLPAEQRRGWFGHAGMRATAALSLLEEAALRRQILLAQQELKRRYLVADPARTGTGGDFEEADASLRQILLDSGFLSRPAELLAAQQGYGLPQPAELASLATETAQRRLRLENLNDQLAAQIRGLLDPPMRANLDGIQANIDFLGGRLRVLHREGGGLELP
jgi:hypothetical protein